ncbi:MAG: glycosyltransferase family 2 protein [Suipraeoptans sp.]
MKVSIVMLAYNHERFIAKALDSVLMQKTTYDYELIVGEDCSTDGTREIVHSYEDKFKGRLKPIYNEKNIGMIKNLMSCFDMCSGEYIAMLEGDDLWISPDKLQKQVDFLENNPDYVVVAHNWNIADKNDNFIRSGRKMNEIHIYSYEDFEDFSIPAQTSTLMSRNIYKEAKNRYWKKLMRYAWIPIDRTIIYLLLTYGKIAILPEIMSTYHFYIEENGSNWSSQYEIAATKNYFYFFVLMLGMESFAKSIKHPINLIGARTSIFIEARNNRHFSKHKKWLWIQGILMLLIEPHKIRLVKQIKQFRKIKGKHKGEE